jgi:hypothetical protein
LKSTELPASLQHKSFVQSDLLHHLSLRKIRS